jgi:predicted phosphodiesterase
MKRVVVLSDIQAPEEDKRLVTAVQRFVAEYEPDEIYCVGDEADMPEPSRWNKGMAGEYSGTFQKGLDRTNEIMGGFREALGDKPFHLMRSNHGDRIRNYIEKYAPAFNSLRDLQYERILGYDELEIKYHDRIWEFAKGWGLAHGDEGSLISTPGGTALSLAKRTGLSIVCGHTHRAGIQHYHTSVNGKTSSRIFGVEVGNMMDMKKAKYLKFGGANWQQGFGLLYIDKGIVTPHVINVVGNKFIVEGQLYDL